MEAERLAAEQYKQQAEQKISDLTFEIRRQHEQYVEVLQNKEESVVLAENRVHEYQVQLADRESIIRCLEIEKQQDRHQIQALMRQIENMVPKQQHTLLQEEHCLAEQKIGSLQSDVVDMSSVIDRINLDK